MRFTDPWMLLLLAGLPAMALLARGSRSGLERGRAIVSTGLRLILTAAAVLALAGAQWVSNSSRTATIFLLDHSYSVPWEVKRTATEWINEQIGRLPEDDAAGVILFGEEAMIEVIPRPHPETASLSSVVGRTATDLGAAIRLALAVFPEGYQKRIVLVSDGNENRGHALSEAEAARAQGAVVDVFPLRYDYPGEAWIEDLHVPSDVLPEEPFDLTIVVNARRAGPGKLVVYRNREVLRSETVRLEEGKNVFTVRQQVEHGGNYAYQAVLEAEGDVVGENNVAYAITSARGEARIAVVPGEPVDGETLVAALAEEGLAATVIPPEELVRRASEIAGSDVVILANVHATRLGEGTMRAIEAAVHDAGVGLIMVGGEDSYGPGGFRGSPIEEVLPVTMEQPQRRVIPNGALVLILHTCEIPDGNHWAKKIGTAALDTLNARDYMGVAMFGSRGDQWLFPLQAVKDKVKLRGLISNAAPGDMPSFDGTMKMAHTGLKGAPAAARHCIIISDADPSGPSPALVDAMVKDRITITTIAIHPHGASDLNKMRAIAARARGRFYHVTDPKRLPQIFIKEAATLQRSMVIEGRVRPSVVGASEALKGISPDDIPPLHGYTLTNAKPLSRISMGMPVADSRGRDGRPQLDVLLAEWTYGLGRTMAFTSDAKPRWAKEWVPWIPYRKFWSQAVRAVIRTVPRAPYAVQTEIEGGRGRVMIDAVDEAGRYLHTLRFKGSVTSPEGRKSALAFRQVGPGRYEAEFETGENGVYSLTGSFEGAHGGKGFFAQGVPLSYAMEYRDLSTNLSLLDRLRERTGGRRLALDSSVYAPLSVTSGVADPLWPLLLTLILILFPLDIFIRRVAVDWADLAAKLRSRLRNRPRRAAPAPAVPETLRALAARKDEVRSKQLAPGTADVDLDAPAAPARPAADAPAAREAPEPPPAPAPEPRPQPGSTLDKLLEAKKKARRKE